MVVVDLLRFGDWDGYVALPVVVCRYYLQGEFGIGVDSQLPIIFIEIDTPDCFLCGGVIVIGFE